jgi:copper chaperone NosL
LIKRPGISAFARFDTFSLLGLVLTALLLSATAVAAEAPKPPPPPDARARCPVCGMLVAPHSAWLAAIVFENGKIAYFDGPKDMFRYYFDLSKFEKTLGPKDIHAVWVTDYYTARPIDARTAWFVIGSDVLGPMGHELVPLADSDKAETFRKDHHGRILLPWDRIKADTLSDIE